MEQTTYVALSRMIALQRQTAMTAHTIANANTPGFKGSRKVFGDDLLTARLPLRADDHRMQNASHPQKAGRGGARRALRAAPFLAVIGAPAAVLAEDQVSGAGSADAAPPDGAEAIEIVFQEGNDFIPAAAQPGWSPAAAQPAPAAPAVPVGARGSEAAPVDGIGGDGGGPGAATRRVSEDALATPREQLLASLPFPAFVPVDPAAGVGGGGGSGGPGVEPPPPNVITGESAAGVIATLTITRRAAPDWVREAVEDDPTVVRFIAAADAGLPADGMTRQVSVAWADIDGDGRRDGHLYRIDNANDLDVTVSVRFANGAMLPGSATVAGDSAGFVWVPITAAATLQFLGLDAEGEAIAWTRAINTQNQSDMRTTTVTRSAWAGEEHEATAGQDVFLFGPGQGVDAIRLYDPGQDSVVLPTGTAAQVVSIGGTAGLLVGGTNREGIVFDGLAWSPTLTLADLNVIFA